MFLGHTLRQRYKIIKLIGGGGFGDTYLALDLDFPGQRQCVVKHLSPKNLDPDAVKTAKRLFIEEAETLSRLGEDDRIPRLHAYFEEDGQFYLVQEFIEGQDLTAEFKPGDSWSEAKVLSLLQEILAILVIVHGEDNIHRDLKPANIMRRNRDGKLVLIDFGAVKRVVHVDSQGEKDSTVVIGTPGYMPPEQAMGNPDKHSDIYALGMLGIQALTGLTSRNLPHESSQFEQIIVEEDISISSQFKTVLSKMISFQPQNRYVDAQETLQAFSNIQIPPKSKSWDKLIPGLLGAISLLFVGGMFAWRSINQTPIVDYAQLTTYLQTKEWQQADQESDRLILSIAEKSSGLDGESIKEFPCESLQKIDELWTSYSQGRFGYTPQKEVYLETGNEFDNYIQSSYEAFGEKVGWTTFGVWSLYGDLKYTDIAPVGHLPSPGRVGGEQQELRTRERGRLLSRFHECGL